MSRVVETKRFGMLIIGWTDMSDRFITRYFLRFLSIKEIPSKKILLYDKCKKVGTIIRAQSFFQIRMYYYNPA